MTERVCAVPGCNKSLYAKELCNTHYKRRQRTGDVQADKAIGAPHEAKTCSVEGCENTATERGWCHGHYLRWVRLGDVMADRPLGKRLNYKCTVDGCANDATARGLCGTHRHRKKKTGSVQAEAPVRKVAGTGYIDRQGYLIVPVPPHLRSLSDGETKIAQHRLVIAIALGRPLTAHESVHHKNGNRTDNRLSNLELWSRWQPSGQRVNDKVDWAREILRAYAPLELAENILL